MGQILPSAYPTYNCRLVRLLSLTFVAPLSTNNPRWFDRPTDPLPLPFRRAGQADTRVIIVPKEVVVVVGSFDGWRGGEEPEWPGGGAGTDRKLYIYFHKNGK